MIESLLSALRRLGTVASACAEMGIAPEAVADARRANRETDLAVREALVEGREARLDRVEEAALTVASQPIASAAPDRRLILQATRYPANVKVDSKVTSVQVDIAALADIALGGRPAPAWLESARRRVLGDATAGQIIVEPTKEDRNAEVT
jgi:hypothetical protein